MGVSRIGILKPDRTWHTYPVMAKGTAVQSAAEKWGFGPLVEILPANTVKKEFSIVSLTVDVSSGADYQFELYVNTKMISQTHLIRETSHVPVTSNILPANSQIRMRIASDDTVAREATVSVHYRHRDKG